MLKTSVFSFAAGYEPAATLPGKPSRISLGAGVAAMALGLVLTPAFSQSAGMQESATASEISLSALPDAPTLSESSSASAAPYGSFLGASQTSTPKMAGRYDKYIRPGQPVPRLSASDKFVLGARDAISPFSIAGWVSSATYEQIVNGSPNYDQTGKGYAQRLGAGALRDITEGMFGDSILAPILHEDPRYYRLGKGHNFIHRVVYAGTRGLITKTDGGRSTINLANLGGNLGGSILTNAYYPQLNRGFEQTAETFGTGVGGSALGFVVSEFLPGIFQAVHLTKPE